MFRLPSRLHKEQLQAITGYPFSSVSPSFGGEADWSEGWLTVNLMSPQWQEPLYVIFGMLAGGAEGIGILNSIECA